MGDIRRPKWWTVVLRAVQAIQSEKNDQRWDWLSVEDYSEIRRGFGVTVKVTVTRPARSAGYLLDDGGE